MRPHLKSGDFDQGIAVAAAVAGLFSRYPGGVAGAVGLPLAASLAFPGLGTLTLLLAAAGLADDY